MRTYQTREDAERDPSLNLKIIWQCNKCRNEREDYPHWNEGGNCNCGGQWEKIGESYEG